MVIVDPTPLIARDKSNDATGRFGCSSVVTGRLPEPSDVGSDESRNAAIIMGRRSMISAEG